MLSEILQHLAASMGDRLDQQLDAGQATVRHLQRQQPSVFGQLNCALNEAELRKTPWL